MGWRTTEVTKMATKIANPYHGCWETWVIFIKHQTEETVLKQGGTT